MSLNIKKRIGRSVEAMSSSASAKERWLQTNSAPPLAGNVVAPDDADFVNRIRHAPQHEPQQRVGQQKQDINRAEQESARRRREKCRAATVPSFCASSQCAPEARNTPTNDHQLAVACTCPLFSRLGRCCNSAAIGTMKKPPAKPKQREQRKRLAERQRLARQPGGKNRKPERAERHEAIFDFAAGKIPRRRAAEADAQRKRGG